MGRSAGKRIGQRNSEAESRKIYNLGFQTINRSIWYKVEGVRYKVKDINPFSPYTLNLSPFMLSLPEIGYRQQSNQLKT